MPGESLGINCLIALIDIVIMGLDKKWYGQNNQYEILMLWGKQDLLLNSLWNRATEQNGQTIGLGSWGSFILSND